MPFKAGDVVILKTTGEKVIALSTVTFPGQPAESVTVRRPVNTRDNGLVHVDNTFFAFELETFEDQLSREFAEAKQIDDIRSKFVGEVKAGIAGAKSPSIN